MSGLVHTEADYFEMSPEERLDAFKRFAQQPHSSKELFEEAQRLDVQSKALAVLLPLKFNESIVAQLKQKPNFQLLQRVCARSLCVCMCVCARVLLVYAHFSLQIAQSRSKYDVVLHHILIR